MGLHLASKNKYWCSTYTGVGFVREWLIRACIEYIKCLEYGDCKINNRYLDYFIECPYEKDLKNEELKDNQFFLSEKKQLIIFLESLLPKEEEKYNYPLHEPPILNYEPWDRTPYSLYYFGLGGLKDFVEHSDCDGYFTVGQSLNLLELISRIYSNLEVLCKEDMESLDELFEVVKDSYDNKCYIIFT